jgi:hypothetical protein
LVKGEVRDVDDAHRSESVGRQGEGVHPAHGVRRHDEQRSCAMVVVRADELQVPVRLQVALELAELQESMGS